MGAHVTGPALHGRRDTERVQPGGHSLMDPRARFEPTAAEIRIRQAADDRVRDLLIVQDCPPAAGTPDHVETTARGSFAVHVGARVHATGADGRWPGAA